VFSWLNSFVADYMKKRLAQQLSTVITER